MTTELKLTQTLKQVISDSLYLSEDKTIELKRDTVSMIWELRIEGKLIDRSQYRHDLADAFNLTLTRSE